MASWVKTLSANQGCARTSWNCGCLQNKEHNVWRTSSTLRFKICSSQDALAWKHLNYLVNDGWNFFVVENTPKNLHNCITSSPVASHRNSSRLDVSPTWKLYCWSNLIFLYVSFLYLLEVHMNLPLLHPPLLLVALVDPNLANLTKAANLDFLKIDCGNFESKDNLNLLSSRRWWCCAAPLNHCTPLQQEHLIFVDDQI